MPADAPPEAGRPAMRVVSGIQPTGDLHLGNLLGAILRWVRMQDEAECLFFLADLHALTIDVEPQQLRSSVREMAAALIASGIDPAKSIVFAHSAVPAHAELAWVLGCTARMGWLNRMTQWKDKAGKNREGASVGLFAYPVLQAADILLYRATHVPVGDDQKQHIELARDIAIKFNTDFDVELFVPPEPYIGGGSAARVMSLRDGTAKMSKSDPSDMSRINLTDSDETIAQKIRKAKTDPEPLPEDPALLAARPEARNLVGIYGAVTGESVEQVLARFAGQGFGAFKPALADALVAMLAPLRARLEAFRSDPAMLDKLLADGAARAAELAAPTLAQAYDAVGLSRPRNA
jgi:tryptophanyl-tRNA synthetase